LDEFAALFDVGAASPEFAELPPPQADKNVKDTIMMVMDKAFISLAEGAEKVVI